MFGFVIGTLCLVALFKLHRAHRWAHHAAWGLPHGGAGPWAHHGFRHRRRHGLHAVFAAVDASPAQEKVIRQAAHELRAAFGDARGEWRATRADLATAIREPSLDAERLGALFVRHDERLGELRQAFVAALAKVHDTLDEGQRQRLADLLESSRAPFPSSPYR